MASNTDTSGPFLQPQQVGYDKKSRPFGVSEAPGRILDFGRQANRLLEDQFQGGFMQQSETLGAGFDASQRKASDQFGAAGLAPEAYMGRFAPQQEMDLASMLAQAAGGAQSGMAEGQLGIEAQLLNSLNEVESYYDTMLAEINTRLNLGS